MLLIKKQPLYSQVAESIIRFIIEDDLSVLPSEEQLSKTFGVSKNTAREALAELKTHGIIEKIHGTGNVVMKSALALQFRIDANMDFLDMLTKAGYTPSIKHLPTIMVEKDSDGEIGEGEYFSYREYLIADDQIACETTLYIPKERLLKIPKERLLISNMFSFITEYTGDGIVQSAVHFLPRSVSKELATLFEVSEDSPLISWDETHYTGKDNPLCYTRVFFNPKIFKPTMIRKGFGISRQRINERCQMIENIDELKKK